MKPIFDLIYNAYRKDYFHLLLAQFFSQFFAFGTVLIVTIFITPVELGNIRILQAYASVFVVIAECGMSTAMLKHSSEIHNIQRSRGLLRITLSKITITTVLSLILLSLLLTIGIVGSDGYLRVWMLVYAVSIPFFALTYPFMNYLQSLKKIKEMALSQVAIRAQTFVLVVIGTWIWGFQGFVITAVIGSVAALAPLLRYIEIRNVFRTRVEIPQNFIKIAIYAAMTSLLLKISYYGDLFVLDHYTNQRAEIGYYSLAAIFVQGAWLIVHSAGLLSIPYFSERSGDRSWFRRKLIQTQAQASVISVVVGVCVYVGVKVLVPLIYNDLYLALLPYLAVLLLKNVIVSSYTIITNAFIGLGKTNYNFIAFSIATPLGLVLAYVMLQRYGIIGVAWAQGITALVTLTLLIALAAHALRDGRHAS